MAALPLLLLTFLPSTLPFLILPCQDGTTPTLKNHVSHATAGKAVNVLTEEVESNSPVNFWVGAKGPPPDGNIVIDLGCVQSVVGFFLKSSNRAGDWGGNHVTKAFEIYSSPDWASPWVKLFDGTLADSRNKGAAGIKTSMFPVDRVAMRYFKFVAKTVWASGKCPTLQYLAAYNGGSLACPALDTETTGTELTPSTESSWQDCAKACRDLAGCTNWWLEAGGTCKMFSAVAGIIPGNTGSGGTSGTVACQGPIDLPSLDPWKGPCPASFRKIVGLTSPQVVATASSWVDCSVACYKDPTCKHWMWELAGSSGTPSTCTNGGDIDSMEEDKDFLAGTRHCIGTLADGAWVTCETSDITSGLAASAFIELTIPDYTNHPVQCIEACRGAEENNPYTHAIYSIDSMSYYVDSMHDYNSNSGKCTCAKNVTLSWPLLYPDACSLLSDTVNQVYQIDRVPKAKHCGELYFQRQCFHVATYITSTFDFRVECRQGKVPSLDGDSWDQMTEKLALRALIFDRDVDLSADTEIEVETSAQTLLGTWNINKFPWTLNSGWRTTDLPITFADTGAAYPTTARTIYVKGMVFSNPQFQGELEFKIRIRYDNDPYHSGSNYYNPTTKYKKKTLHKIVIQKTDLDESGIYFFKDPDDPTQPIEFAMTSIELSNWIAPTWNLELGTWNFQHGITRINFDFVGTYYSYDTAVDGKHEDAKADNFNTLDIGEFLAKDGTEAEGTYTSITSATNWCRSHCSSEPMILYSGIRMLTLNKWKCRCFTSADLDDLVGMPKHLSPTDPRSFARESDLVSSLKPHYESDSALGAFLITGLELKNKAHSWNATISNVCNHHRKVNLATIYLARALNLNVGNLISSYTYDAAATPVFPDGSNGPTETFIPDSLAAYPDLEQAFWTIMDQYTNSTEPGLRSSKDRNWCHYQAMAAYSHCQQAALEATADCTTAWAAMAIRGEAGEIFF